MNAEHVHIREVGLRDGLQSIARTMPTAHKLEWLHAACAAGLREMEVGSFVPPRLLPRLPDTAELVAENFKPGALKNLGLDCAALSALNERLICVSHKGFLPGPCDQRPALDEVVQMMGGPSGSGPAAP